MQGDPKVDELMRPVLAAIKRHVKNSDAVTDIYNRAYEAVMNSMDVKTGKTYCAYCGAEYPLDDAAATLVSEHIKTCEKHPMRETEKRAEKAEARAERYEEALQQIDTWAKAYPLDAFPEPDFKRVREVLEAAGITIDQVSASNMRHVITGVARIVEKALKGGEE